MGYRRQDKYRKNSNPDKRYRGRREHAGVASPPEDECQNTSVPMVLCGSSRRVSWEWKGISSPASKGWNLPTHAVHGER